MPPTPDIVRLSELEVDVPKPRVTRHVYDISRPGQRKIRQREEWKRQKDLGSGAFGAVYLEQCTEGDKVGSVRAVKVIQKSTNINYDRELEAIALFSHQKVGTVSPV